MQDLLENSRNGKGNGTNNGPDVYGMRPNGSGSGSWSSNNSGPRRSTSFGMSGKSSRRKARMSDELPEEDGEGKLGEDDGNEGENEGQGLLSGLGMGDGDRMERMSIVSKFPCL